MATQKKAGQQHKITASLTDEERDLLEAFADEQGIDDLGLAVPAMIHELVRLHDQLWDTQFAHIPPALDAMAQKALDDDRAGLPKDLDI